MKFTLGAEAIAGLAEGHAPMSCADTTPESWHCRISLAHCSAVSTILTYFFDLGSNLFLNGMKLMCPGMNDCSASGTLQAPFLSVELNIKRMWNAEKYSAPATQLTLHPPVSGGFQVCSTACAPLQSGCSSACAHVPSWDPRQAAWGCAAALPCAGTAADTAGCMRVRHLEVT